MIVVASRTSYLRSMKSSIARSSSCSPIWPCADDHARFGHEPLDQSADREDRLDPVVDEVDLAAARQLGSDGALDDVLHRT